MKLPAVKRLSYDNVPEEQQQTVETIANIINPFMDDVSQIVNGNINFDNLSFKTAKFEVKTDSNGLIIGQLIINTGLKKQPTGCLIMDLRMSNDSNSVPNIDNTPFMLWRAYSESTVKVDKILNLKANSAYLITVMFI